MARRYSSKITANERITGTEARLARVFGRLTTDRQMERVMDKLVVV
jgi:hypothetical protein